MPPTPRRVLVPDAFENSGDATLAVFDLRQKRLEGRVTNQEDELLSIQIVKASEKGNGHRHTHPPVKCLHCCSAPGVMCVVDQNVFLVGGAGKGRLFFCFVFLARRASCGNNRPNGNNVGLLS